jgi:hypothetical protein
VDDRPERIEGRVEAEVGQLDPLWLRGPRQGLGAERHVAQGGRERQRDVGDVAPELGDARRELPDLEDADGRRGRRSRDRTGSRRAGAEGAVDDQRPALDRETCQALLAEQVGDPELRPAVVDDE